VGLVPSGSQDPFALRRHAYAVVRILVEGTLSVSVKATILDAVRLLKEQGIPVDDKAPAELQRFLGERLRYYCQEVGKLRADLVEAVLSQWQSSTFNPLDIWKRARVLQAFAARPEFEALVIACKRAENITKSHHDDHVDEALFQDLAEKTLYSFLLNAEETVASIIRDADYTGALNALVVLREPIDALFAGVMVMVEDGAIRKNRLALLVRVRNLFRQYADFSRVNVEIKQNP